MVRIYDYDVKNWQLATGASGAGIFLLLSYLVFSGAITVQGFSGDSQCAGTELEPCYAYINFTAKKDIAFSLKDFKSEGAGSLFEYDPSVKDWKLQYQYYSKWYDYNESQDVVWLKGKSYRIRVIAYKNKPSDSIKWSAFSGQIDPYWYGIGGENYTTYDECHNELSYSLYQNNLSREVFTNSTPASYIENYTEYVSYSYNESVCVEAGIDFGSIRHPYIQADKQCLRTGDTLCCWLYSDGGTNIQSRSGAFRTSIDSGERGICVDLASNLTVLSKQGDVSIP